MDDSICLFPLLVSRVKTVLHPLYGILTQLHQTIWFFSSAILPIFVKYTCNLQIRTAYGKCLPIFSIGDTPHSLSLQYVFYSCYFMVRKKNLSLSEKKKNKLLLVSQLVKEKKKLQGPIFLL